MGGPPGEPGGDGRSLDRAERGVEAILKSREGSGGPGEFRSPTHRAGMGREAFPEGWKGLGRTGEVGRPIQMAVRGCEGSGGPPEGLAGMRRPS